MSKRILITGARDWPDTIDGRFVIEQALIEVLREWGHAEDITLVEGECPYGGADEVSRMIWEDWWERPVEKVPANWKELGKRAGPYRNQLMVDRGADICLAFPGPSSRGTWDCVRRAEQAGIPVRVFDLDKGRVDAD